MSEQVGGMTLEQVAGVLLNKLKAEGRIGPHVFITQITEKPITWKGAHMAYVVWFSDGTHMDLDAQLPPKEIQ